MSIEAKQAGKHDATEVEAKLWDVAVIGGGAAGLAAAALAAQGGCSVVLLESAERCGGRAASRTADGAVLNLGAHALYRKGPAERVLDRLGVRPQGKAPTMNITWMLDREGAVSTVGLLFGGQLAWAEKRQLIAGLVRIRKMQPEAAAGKSWRQQLNEFGITGTARDILEAMGRLGTYAGEADRLDAGATIGQLQKSVMYPDGGWQSIVDGLVHQAQAAGVKLLTSCAVSGATPTDGGWTIAHKGGAVQARQIIAAASPAKLQDWFGAQLPADYARALSAITPVTATCLDVHLRKLPNPAGAFVLGAQEPIYLSAHSRWAKLVQQPGHAVVHVMRYNGSKKVDADQARQSLEDLLNRMQPGWRRELVSQRYMPNLVVSHASPTSELGGSRLRPAVNTGVAGLYAAGDWAGNEGLLLDASLASAEEAARLAIIH